MYRCHECGVEREPDEVNPFGFSAHDSAKLHAEGWREGPPPDGDRHRVLHLCPACARKSRLRCYDGGRPPWAGSGESKEAKT